MRNRELASQLDSLKSLLAVTDTATGGNIELVGHWGRYLCVLTAGFLENALREVFSEFVRNAASPQVASFATRRLERISNPKSGRFIETAQSFDFVWASDLEDFLNADGGRRRNAIDSIMSNRNRIAHGESVQVSVGRVREYLPGCIQVVEFIENQLLGTTSHEPRAV
ncbi:MAG: HEPN domain-containing protein [Chloroflexota bacterium]|nr:HEPN domain-containing protein [Chloroflexota bacterium]MDE2941285.1 HEPN domain-containing protein [Chloroflexota bacterium]